MVPPHESDHKGWRPSIIVHPPHDCKVVRGGQASSMREQARGSVVGVAWLQGPAPSRATGKGALL
jgi:hypothetical protein